MTKTTNITIGESTFIFPHQVDENNDVSFDIEGDMPVYFSNKEELFAIIEEFEKLTKLLK